MTRALIGEDATRNARSLFGRLFATNTVHERSRGLTILPSVVRNTTARQPSELVPTATRRSGNLLRAAPAVPDSAALDPGTRVEVARGMNRGAGVLAASVLLDSAIEHYRGGFHNPAMFLPLVSSALSIAASAHGAGDRNSTVTRERHFAYTAAAATGFAGMGFHAYNVGKRTGGFSWLNLFYGAPLGAPAALILSGLLGVAAERVRDATPGRRPSLFGMPEDQAIAAVTAGGLTGTVAEAALLHFRGAFQDPFMYLPVTVPPVAATLMAGVALNPRPEPRPFTRFWLRLTALIGFAGTGFHIIGVHRNMGGWHNWTQNIQNGPPIPAPPSFTGLALAGLAVLKMLEKPRHG
jgi:hypothetical protein